MKRVLAFIAVIFCMLPVMAEELKTKPSVNVIPKEYTLEVTVDGIPENQQTLFIPIKIDTSILDFDKVALEDISAQNILAVASTSKDKVGTGIGLLKLDENGLPPELTLKVLLKPVGKGQTDVSLLPVAEEPALLSRGAVINNGVKVNINNDSEIEVVENVENNKKRLVLNESKITLDIIRTAPNEESIFVPLIFDKKIVDLDETFGHAIVGPGISIKSFSSGSLHEGGPGVEIVLSADAPKDFSIDVDLLPRGSGKVKLIAAFPQKGHAALVQGPVVNINPTNISVLTESTVVLDKN